MSNFTCINCNVIFHTAEIQREHYKTDWHRYNLKRRIAGLPPVAAEKFQSHVLNAQSKQLDETQETVYYCNACRKQFGNEKAHNNHLNSKKHKENLEGFHRKHENQDIDITVKTTTNATDAPTVSKKTKAATTAAAIANGVNSSQMVMVDDDDSDYMDEEVEEVDSDEWEEIPENPLTENDCLFCTHTSEDIVENMKHMSVAHSFFIPDMEYCTDVVGLLYYLGEKITLHFVCLWCNERGKTFYSLDAVRKHMICKGHCQMWHEGMALAEYADYYDYSSSYPDHNESMDIDEEVVPDLLDGDEYQLVLPSGAVIGHRSLLRYYKQRLDPNRRMTAVKKSDKKYHKILSEYRSLGWTQTQQQAAARKARDIHLMKRVQSKWQMKLGCRANKLQHHYRQQVMF